MVVKKWKAMFGEFFFCNIGSSLPSPNSKNLYLRLKNNQNQMNTIEAQNLKEFNNTAGWLSGFL